MTKARELLNQLDMTKSNEASIKDEIGKFWVVTWPKPSSELEDVLFQVDVFGFANQVRGGLEKSEVAMLTKNQSEAKSFAEKVLTSSKKEV